MHKYALQVYEAVVDNGLFVIFYYCYHISCVFSSTNIISKCLKNKHHHDIHADTQCRDVQKKQRDGLFSTTLDIFSFQHIVKTMAQDILPSNIRQPSAIRKGLRQAGMA